MSLSDTLYILHGLRFSANLMPVERDAIAEAIDILNAKWLAQHPAPTPLERPDEE